MEKLLTEQQAAEYLGQSRRTLQQWRWQHRGLKYIKVGRNVRYRLEDLKKFIENNAVDISDGQDE